MILSTDNVKELRNDELQSVRLQVPFDNGYALEIVRAAIVEQTGEAWSLLERCFSQIVRSWIHSHPSREVALKLDTEENYIAQTFSRFWNATRTQKTDFTELPAVLSSLHATLNGAINDTLRFHFRACEVPFPESVMSNQSTFDESIEIERLWEGMQKLLYDERERRIFYLLYACGLKPREIVSRCPQEFPEVKEIYQLNKNIIERLRRNSGRLRYLVESEA